jgi:hypothetical protein
MPTPLTGVDIRKTVNTLLVSRVEPASLPHTRVTPLVGSSPS